jgi:hypothetical protein
MSAPAAPDRRHNRSLRNQAQAWFDALRLHITEVEGAEAIATLINGWQKPEDVMHAYPALVPLFLDMIWRSRKTPGFADLFRTDSGEVAEMPTEVLALSQKSFDDIVIAHLMGTVRLVCERQRNEWLAVEREKRRGALSRMPVVGAALRGIGLLSPAKTEVLLADYPQKGLYDALKPCLCRREQFALVEVLAALPTRTVSMLGPIVGTLQSPAAIRALGELNRATAKIALELAETFVEAIGSVPVKAGETPLASPSDSNPLAPVGQALSDMLQAGPAFVNMASLHKDLAKEAITKLAPAVKAEIWTIIADAETLRRIAECPAGVVQTLQGLTTEINERVSLALAEITDDRVTALAMKALRGAADPDTFVCWLRDEAYLTAWKQLALNLNRDTAARSLGDEILPNHKSNIMTICTRGALVFEEIGEPQKKAA